MVRITPAGTATQRRFRAQAIAAMRGDLDALSDRQLRSLDAATGTLSSFVDDLQRQA